MEQTETNEPAAGQTAVTANQQLASPVNRQPEPLFRQPVTPATCTSCGAAMSENGYSAAGSSYVFAIGRVEMRFPTLGIEKGIRAGNRPRQHEGAN